MSPRYGSVAFVLVFGLLALAAVWAQPETADYHVPRGDVRLSAVEQNLSDRIRHAFGLRELPLPRLHPDVVLAARQHAQALLDDQASDLESRRQEDLREGLRRVGVSDYPVRGGMALGTDPEGVLERLVAWSGGLEAGDWNRLGVGIARSEERVAAVVLLTRHMVELAPVPKHLPEPGSIVLEGRAPPATGGLRIYLTAPSGGVSSLSPTQIASGAFSQPVALDTAGLHRVELLADSGRGPQVAALLHVCVGHCAQQQALPALGSFEGGDPAQARAYVHRWVDAFRRLHGLPPLAPDERLRGVMEGHLARLIVDAPLAHRDAEGRGPDRRLADAGLDVAAYAENLGRHSHLHLLLEKLTESPAHRKNLLAAHLTHLGVGVMRHEDAGVWIVGQLFAAFASAPPPAGDNP